MESDLFDPTEAVPLGILQAKVTYYLQQGRYMLFDAMSRQALDNVQFAPGAQPDGILYVKEKRPLDLQKIGSFGDAEDVAQEIWKGHRATYGPSHIKTLYSSDKVAAIYQEQGKYRKGEKEKR